MVTATEHPQRSNQLSLEVLGGTPNTVAVTGELDLASAPMLEEVLIELVGPEGQDVVVDLGGVEFMDVSGVRVLRDAHEAAAERGQRVELANWGRQPRRLLAIVGEERLMLRSA